MKRFCQISAVVLFCASACLGWGEIGHKTAANIAERYLSPEAKSEVARLLGDESMADVALWGDKVSTQPAYRWTQPHCAYVADGADSFDMQRDCPDGKCVVARVILFKKTLQNPNVDKKSRADALRFLIHFIPDMHNPVHVVRKKEKAAQVEFFDEKVSVHLAWDNLLIDRLKTTPAEYSSKLLRKITATKIKIWTKDKDPSHWATESFRHGIKTAYVLPSDGRVSQDYVDRCMPIVHERLSMAGVRLAAVLNEVFGGQMPTPSAAMAAHGDKECAKAARQRSLPNVLIIGDSISMGYTRVVRELLKDRANVQRPNANCGDTRRGLANLKQWLGDTPWDVIHFNWGLHDLCYRNAQNPGLKSQGSRDKVNGKISVPIELYEQNLEKLIQQLKATGAALIWASTTVVPEGERGRFAGDDKKYNDVAAKVMRRHDILINDLYALTKSFPPDLFKGPGNVHYTKAGSQQLGKAVAAAIGKALNAHRQSRPQAATLHTQPVQ